MSDVQTLGEGLPDAVSTSGTIDWLTVTAKEREARVLLWDEALCLKEKLQRLGEELIPWKFKGYAGYKIGKMRWGSREDSDIAVLSGQDAHGNWGKFGEAAANCTRIDLAVTTTLAKAWPGLAEGYYRWHEGGNGRPDVPNLGFTLLQNTYGGETIYVGSRKSQQFGRIYDKGAEQANPELTGHQWRYEVEYKKPLAGPVLEALLGCRGGASLPEKIRGTVHNWFARRDCPPVFSDAGAMIEIETEARVTSEEVKLWWLSSQVCPSVSYLIERGRLEDVVKALGLWERVTVDNDS